MKKLTSIALSVLLPLLAFVAITIPTVPLTGCQSTGVAAGSEAFVVEAEKDLRTSFSVVDAFLQWEASNRAIAGKDVTKVADTLRVEFPKALASARETLRVYKSNRTPENRGNLATWLATVNEAMLQSIKYMPASTATAAYNTPAK